MSIDIEKVNTAFNMVIGKERKSISKALVWSNSDEVLYQDATPESGVQENQFYVGFNTKMSKVWQAYVDTKVSSGELTFLPTKTLQRRHMVKMNFKPEKVRGSLNIGQLANETDEIDAMQIVKLAKAETLESIENERVEDVIYKAKYVQPTNNAYNAGITAVDGFGTLIEAGLEADPNDAANRMNHWDIGALDEDTIYQQVKDLVKQTDPKYWTKPLNFYWSPLMMLWYKENREATIGGRFNTEDKSLMTIPGTNWNIRVSAAMTGSVRCWATPKGNMKRVYDQINNLMNIKSLITDIDALTIHANWCESYAFDFSQLVWANHFTSSSTDNEAETYAA